MNFYDFDFLKWFILILSAATIGMAKTGLSGINMPFIIFLAVIFNGRPSTGLVLPMLIVADIFGVLYYIKHASWKYVFILMPYTLIGILLAVLIGKFVPNNIFNILIGLVVLISLIIMFLRNNSTILTKRFFPVLMGSLSGFSSMIGNSASSVMAVYLLSMKLPKNNFIATSVVFFASINLIKLPLHIFYWRTINIQSLLIDIFMIPAIAIGVFIGILIVKKIPEKPYKYFIIISTILSVFILIIRSIFN